METRHCVARGADSRQDYPVRGSDAVGVGRQISAAAQTVECGDE
jgi:hypothetical protein